MDIPFKIGTGIQMVTVEDYRLLGVLQNKPLPDGPAGRAAVEEALAHPIGTPRLWELVRPGETVAVITSDITRPMPTWEVMPVLLDELYAAGIRREDIILIFALGSHRNHTPVDIDRRVAEADRRICLGNIEYHYFAGYSGGAKAIMPGVSTRAAIQANHSRMVCPEARSGLLEGNPVREDIEEAAAMVGADFMLNVVLDGQKNIVKAVAGDITLAHRAGCAFLDSIYRVDIQERADVVLVSQGGAPKDLNLYQTQKALDNALRAVKPGGVVVLIGSCAEGLGERVFEEWMLSAPSPDFLIRRIQREFCLGGHKAAAIAMAVKKAGVYLVSDLDKTLVERLFMRPFSTFQEAYDAAIAERGPGATVLAMPYGGSTLPNVIERLL
ncbi:nickel-dependent lactate racemase [uncultured Oscillibacter sp.]|uniref:nickel-dependent lactate racemase n=1 Tax=uncultured Oscillibacter sp. TaxID=876091 RepID=UPI00260602BD|nr:nickel-dependent lactate racemase [uncultured Oscillibacter sp.]